MARNAVPTDALENVLAAGVPPAAVAEAFGVSKATIYEWRKNNEMPRWMIPAIRGQYGTKVFLVQVPAPTQDAFLQLTKFLHLSPKELDLNDGAPS